MKKIAVGIIPEKISYVYSVQTDVNTGCSWDIDYLDEKSPKEKVYPTFPADAGDEKMMIRASEWAKNNNQSWDSKKNEWIKTKIPVTINTVDNKPIKKVRLLSLEFRGEGGRAYKVLLDDKYYVDMREDVLVDVLLQTGITNGILGGEYVWGKLGSQMRLMRIGSELHKMLQTSTIQKDMPKIKPDELEVGGVYRSRKGEHGIFIGYVNTTEYTHPTTKDRYTMPRPKPDFNFKKTNRKKSMIFFEPYPHEDPKEAFKELDIKETEYRFKIRKSHNFIEKVGDVKITKDFVAIRRKQETDKIKQDILEFTGHKAPKKGYARLEAWTLVSNICYNSEWLNVSKYGDPAPELFDVKKYLVFS